LVYVVRNVPVLRRCEYAVAKAMRQPITAEALEAAGWESRRVSLYTIRYTYKQDRWLTLEWNDDDNRWEFALGRLGRTIVASPTNMYDLGELVRLLSIQLQA
jgi:hypothetical protein